MVETLSTLGKAQLPAQITRWLDVLDENGRWALLEARDRRHAHRRVGASRQDRRGRRSATRRPDDIEIIWPGLARPITELFAWLEGRGDKPVNTDPAPFRPAMLAHAIEENDLDALDAADFIGGMEMGRHPGPGRERPRRTRRDR